MYIIVSIEEIQIYQQKNNKEQIKLISLRTLVFCVLYTNDDTIAIKIINHHFVNVYACSVKKEIVSQIINRQNIL